MNNNKQLIDFIIDIKKSFPENDFLDSFNIFLKLFTLFLITHDWNIHSNKGITTYLIEINIIPSISRFENQLVASVITFAYILICLVPIVLFLISKYGMSDINKKRKKIQRYGSVIIFYLFYLFNQHFYMLTVETYFCQGNIDSSTEIPIITSIGTGCRNPMNYITIALQSLLIILFVLFNYFIIISVYDPFFFSRQFILNNIGFNACQWILYPFGLLILELEYHIPFLYIAIIKIVVRFVFVIFFIINYLIKSHTYYSNVLYYYCHTMTLSICFISCIIEFIFLYDWNNNLILLQSNINYIIGKLLIEILLAISVSYYIHNKDHDGLNTLGDFNKKNINEQYALYNKYFYHILHPFVDIDITNRIVNKLHEKYACHRKKKCFETTKGCFCAKYKSEDIAIQSKNYLFNTDFHGESLIDEYDDLKNNFPAMYNYIEYSLEKKLEKIEGTQPRTYLQLIAALFYLVFEKNVNKSFFYVEKFKRSNLYKKSFISRIQVQLINEFILVQNQKLLKIRSSNYLSYSTEFDHLNDYIMIDNILRDTLFQYIEFIRKASILNINQSDLVTLMSKFSKSLINNSKVFQAILSSSQCNLKSLSTKLYFYFLFFNGSIPDEKKELFNDITKEKINYLSVEEYSTLILKYSNDKKSLFTIEYASDDILNILLYTNSELMHKSFNDVLLNEFSDGYVSYIYNEIQSGSSSFIIPNICFKTKKNSCKIQFLIGIILFHDNNLHIFIKICPVDCIPFAKLDSFLNTDPKYIKSKTTKLIEKDSCYILTNKSGRLTSLSQEFEAFFCLHNKFIKTNKVNLFKDILNQVPTQNGYLSISLAQIYENIADFLSAKILENNQDKSEIEYQQIKKIQHALKLVRKPVLLCIFFEPDSITRPNKPAKLFNYVIFKIQIMTDHLISIAHFFHKEMTSITISQFDSVIPWSKEIKKTNENAKPSLTDNPRDIISKFTLIKQFACKILVYFYNINESQLDKQALMESEHLKKDRRLSKKIPIITKQGSIDKDCTTSELKQCTQKNRGDKHLITHLTIFIIGVALFLILSLVIISLHGFLFDQGLDIVYCNLFITVTKKIIISFAASSVHMQVFLNDFQTAIIGDNFTNDIAYHETLLKGRVVDYLNNYMLFMKHFVVIKDPSKAQSDSMMQTIYSPFEGKILGVNLLSEFQSMNMYDILQYIHIKVASGFWDKLARLVFNETIIKDGKEYNNYSSSILQDYDYLIDDQEVLIAEKSMIFFIENTLTDFKYRLDEYVHIFQYVYEDHNKQSLNFLFIFIMSALALVIIIAIVEIIGYFQLNTQIFIIYFNTYLNIQYFNKFIMKKAMIIKNLMDITIQTTFDEINHTKLFIKHSLEENAMIQLASRIIEDDQPFDIHAFEPFVHIKGKTSIDSINNTNNDDLPRKKLNQTIHDKSVNLSNSKKILKSPIDKKQDRNKTFQKGFESPKVSATASNDNFDSMKIMTNSSINQTTDMLVKPEELSQPKNKRILGKRTNTIMIIITITFIILPMICFSIVHYILIEAYFNTLKTYLKVQSISLQRIISFHELLIIFEISVLKNKEMIFDYKSNGYLNATTELDYINNISTHKVFDEVVAVINSLEKENDKMLNDINKNPYQKTMRLYEDIINSENFCTDNGKFLEDHKNYMILPLFQSMVGMTSEFLAANCIRQNFFQKGFKAAKLSLIYNLQKEHIDFINEENRTGDYNKGLLNSNTIYIYQAQSHRLLDSIFINYQVSSSKDYNDRYKQLVNYEYLFNGLLITFIVIVILIYLAFYLAKYQLEHMIIDDIEEIIFSSVVF